MIINNISIKILSNILNVPGENKINYQIKGIGNGNVRRCLTHAQYWQY